MKALAVRVLFIGLALSMSLVISVAVTGCGHDKGTHTQYHCPMHPTYVADASGDCPICGMSLVPIEAAPEQKSFAAPAPKLTVNTGTAGAPQPSGDRRILHYRNPMDPSVTSAVPAKDQMGMDYVPVYADEAGAPGLVSGLSDVTVSGEGVALAGVVTAPAMLAPMTREIRTVGVVVPDETRVRHVHTKFSGWVERLFVSYTGQPVHKGAPMLSIFSPEIVASQEELLEARRAADALKAVSSAEAQSAGEAIARAGERRLELLDVPPPTVEALGRGEIPKRTITLTAPVSGFVTDKQVFPGQQVDPGTELFTITDLKKVWVEAAIYENEATLVRVGQRATLTFPYDQTKKIESAVSYVFPYLDTATRTQKIRFNLDNPDLTLKPGMFVDVDLEVLTEQGVVIPDSAIIDTGKRQIVYVEVGAGRFQPRLVEIGTRGKGMALVQSGLNVGDRVVTRGNFLIDSESRIRASVSTANKPASPPLSLEAKP